MRLRVGETSIMTTDASALLLEANRLNYRLRSAFFYRKLKEYNTLAFPLIIAELFPIEDSYNWDERESWSIGEDAFTYVKENADLRLIQVFCHPNCCENILHCLSTTETLQRFPRKPSDI